MFCLIVDETIVDVETIDETIVDVETSAETIVDVETIVYSWCF